MKFSKFKAYARVAIASLPIWMQRISFVLPLTRGIASARKIIAGNDYRSVTALLNGEVIVGITYVFLGYALFRWFEMQAKRRGTLEVM